MELNNAKLAGTLLLLGSIQFTILLMISEAIYPNYSISTNFISDLGVWGEPSALMFNSSIILLGLLGIIGSYFVKKTFNLGKVAYLLTLGSLGSLLVGFFPENAFLIGDLPLIHIIAAFLTFIMNAAAAIAACTYTKSPFRIFSIILGVVSLVSLVFLTLFLTTGGNSGIGLGGIERMVVYPTLLWSICFGGYLLSLPNDVNSA